MLSIAVLTAALFSTSAFAAPSIEARSEIACTGQPALLANLRIFSEPSSDQQILPSGDVLGTAPVRNSNGSEYLQKNDENGGGQFMFYSCESTYLGYPSVQGFGNDVIRFHGQVRLAGNDSCLVVDSENGVVLSACSTVDDASQTSQFWTVLQNKTEPAPLNFIGNITNDVDNPSAAFYSFGYGYLGGNPVVSAGFHNGSEASSNYALKMIQLA